MKQHGRPSPASIELMAIAPAGLDRVPRMKSPHDLTDEESEVWSSIVNSESADWFTPSTVPLLAQYCRHVIRARYVAELIEQATGKASLEDYDRLLKMQERESRSMTALATKMRITQRSTINKRGHRVHGTTIRPWEKEAED